MIGLKNVWPLYSNQTNYRSFVYVFPHLTWATHILTGSLSVSFVIPRESDNFGSWPTYSASMPQPNTLMIRLPLHLSYLTIHFITIWTGSIIIVCTTSLVGTLYPWSTFRPSPRLWPYRNSCLTNILLYTINTEILLENSGLCYRGTHVHMLQKRFEG